MDRKKKLKIIQLSLLIIGLIVMSITYLSDNNFNKKNLISLEAQNKLRKNFDKDNNNLKGNVFDNIEYSGLDLAGNRYILKSKSAATSNINENLIDMSDVTAIFYFKDGTILNIKSEFGEYNNKSLDIKFKKNIKADYEKSTMEAEYAEYSNSKGFLTVSDTVKVNDIQGSLLADKLLFDVKNQTLKIETFNDKRINVNVDTDEKRF